MTKQRLAAFGAIVSCILIVLCLAGNDATRAGSPEHRLLFAPGAREALPGEERVEATSQAARGASLSMASEVIITASEDVGLWQLREPNMWYGDAPGDLQFFRVGFDDHPSSSGCPITDTDCYGQELRALLRFDVTGAPSDATWIDLSLSCIGSWDAQDTTQTLTVCLPLTSSWDEGTATWTNAPQPDLSKIVLFDFPEGAWGEHRQDIKSLIGQQVLSGTPQIDLLLLGPVPTPWKDHFVGQWREFTSSEFSSDTYRKPALIFVSGDTPTPTPTFTPSITPSLTRTATPTITPTPTLAGTWTPSPYHIILFGPYIDRAPQERAPTHSPTPSPTATLTPTLTSTAIPTQPPLTVAPTQPVSPTQTVDPTLPPTLSPRI